MVYQSESRHAALMALIYCLSVTALFGTSALYHRVHWNPTQRAWMRRLDHTMIFFLIAGTYTPLAAIKLDQEVSTFVLYTVWLSAALGSILKLVWITAPKWLAALLYLSLGWFAVYTMPSLYERVGWGCVSLLMIGGVFYTLGALAYVFKRPNPLPSTFGYHEIFHAFVIIAAAFHYAAILKVIT